MNYVYIIGNLELNYFKIGVSSVPSTRLKQLDTPFDLQIFHTEPCGTITQAFEVERRAHMEFHQQRVRGEWFQNIDLAYAIETVKRLREKHCA